MTKLNLPASTIKKVIDDPTLLGAFSDPTNPLRALGVTSADASDILAGYTAGFRGVFLMNATLAAAATVVSVFMIKHKELTRGDEERLRAEAVKGGKEKQDVELGVVDTNTNENVGKV